ncbi:hypothetical protein [Streptomyces indicus]|uniref:Uncharacterized protein n=1 Tax=Streptomyces indicus TaxID=417292 RepID=A0A1G9FGN7_9ACTN|nr:hypothetical protein [Streptomyces indicus]SDK87601.1 hypothetical protein SAMN05421806_113113 [Streptomyces indicus]
MQLGKAISTGYAEEEPLVSGEREDREPAGAESGNASGAVSGADSVRTTTAPAPAEVPAG